VVTKEKLNAVVIEDSKDTLLLKWLEVEDEPTEEFLKKFDDCTLQTWDHRAHLRIAWAILTLEGRQKGMKHIFSGIKNFIEKSAISRKTTFHETMTYFWAHMVHYAINSTKNPTNDFKGFLALNPQLANSGLFLDYYNKDTMLNNPEARKQVVLPDKKPLPSIISTNLPPQQKPIDIIKPLDNITDSEFLQKFESCDTSLEWNHYSLLRIITLYVVIIHNDNQNNSNSRKGFDKLQTPLDVESKITTNLKKFLESRKQVFHFTQTTFWIQMVYYYIMKSNQRDTLLQLNNLTSLDKLDNLLKAEPKLNNPRFFLDFYKIDTILNSKQAQESFIAPDKSKLPTL